MRRSLLFLATLACACGGSTAIALSSPNLSSPDGDPACSDAATPNGDGTATTVDCPFYQQVDNIHGHGQALVSTGSLVDGAGHTVASVSYACGNWWLGLDPDRSTVIINKVTGEVRSHGTLHAGQPISSLPEQLTGPLTIHQ
jgi:hypothetical protein